MPTSPKTAEVLTLIEIAERWAFKISRQVSEIISILFQAVGEKELVISDFKKGARIMHIIINQQGKREELLDPESAIISRDNFASWYSSRQPSLDSWWPPLTDINAMHSPISETERSDSALGRKPRKQRKHDTEADAMLRNKIEKVLAAARSIAPKNHLDLRPLSAEVYRSGKSPGFREETVRKILAGTYPAQKRLGIRGLR